MNVLHVAPAFYPATYWGGPTYSTLGICTALSELEDVNLRVLTTDTAGPRLSDRVDPAAFCPSFPIRYARKRLGVDIAPEMIPLLWSWAKWADVIHLTGVYSFPTLPVLLIARIFRKPVIWSPRGAFMKWERRSMPFAKSVWKVACKLLLDPAKTKFHVTSSDEAEATSAQFPLLEAFAVPNAVDAPLELPQRGWKPDGNCRLLFLGRLHPIKAVENLLAAMGLLQPVAVSLTICGDGDPRYVGELKSLSAKLGLTNVNFCGHVDGAAKASILSQTDILVLPSFAENFGIVVLEALAHGVPVLASRGTPWSQLHDMRCGVWIENSPESLANGIKQLCAASDLAEMGARGREWVRTTYSWRSSAEALLKTYARIIAA